MYLEKHHPAPWVVADLGRIECAKGHKVAQSFVPIADRMLALAPELLDYIRRSASNCPEANELLKRATGEQR